MTNTPASDRRGAFEPLRSAQFTTTWLAGTVAYSANWMQSIAVPFIVYQMTGSATWLGFAAVAGQLPSIISSPLGGVWADRYERRFLLLTTITVQACVAFAMYWMYTSDLLTPERIVGLLVISGFASSAHITIWQPFVAQLVPQHAFGAAYRLNAIQFNLSRAVGPAMAGFVLAQFGAGAAFFVNACAYLPFAVAILVCRPRKIPRSPRTSPFAAFRAGAAVAFRHPGLTLPIVSAAFLSIFGQGIHPLMAGMASEVFRVGEQGFGLLMSSIGGASVIGSIAIVLIGNRVDRSTLAQIGLYLYAVGVIVLAATDIFAVGLFGLAVTGLAHVLVHISTTTALQLHVTEELRGRVTSIYLMGIIAFIPVGAQTGGYIADQIGLSIVIGAYGIALAIFAVYAHVALGGMAALDGDEPVIDASGMPIGVPSAELDDEPGNE